MLEPAAPAGLVATAIAHGRYRVTRVLGKGSSKIVYLARDLILDREVAIAMFHTEGLDAAGRARIVREARAMARLTDHPHIVNVFDIGGEGGQPFIVSQYMSGGTVDELIARAPGRRLAVEMALRITEQVAEALVFAHSLGIVHRDIKPANIFLDHEGQARLGDFGLATARDQARLTVHGMMVGTAAYLPPEQALGGALEPRSDLYSLGAMLYEMLCGRPPFVGADLMAIISQHLNAQPALPSSLVPGLSPALDALVMKLLEKRPERRPPNAAAVIESLRAIASASRETMDILASTLMVERPNLSTHAAPDGTVSILFSDIENSTMITERLGDLRAQELLHIHNRIIRVHVAREQGYEVKSMGDGFMIAFASARHALRGAIAIQREFALYCAAHPDEPLRVRIGLNLGEAIREAGDFYGKAVILAARIGAAAQAGEILVSSTFKEITESAGDISYSDGVEMHLKGLSGTYRVYRAQWPPPELPCHACGQGVPLGSQVCPRCAQPQTTNHAAAASSPQAHGSGPSLQGPVSPSSLSKGAGDASGRQRPDPSAPELIHQPRSARAVRLIFKFCKAALILSGVVVLVFGVLVVVFVVSEVGSPPPNHAHQARGEASRSVPTGASKVAPDARPNRVATGMTARNAGNPEEALTRESASAPENLAPGGDQSVFKHATGSASDAAPTITSTTPPPGSYSTGISTGTADVQQDAVFLFYYSTVQDKIEKAWNYAGGSADLTAVVDYAIGPDGSVTNVKIVQSSNDYAFDESVIRAIRRAAPFAPPPEKYRALWRDGVQATFRLRDLTS